MIGITLGLPKAHYSIIATIISAVAKYALNYVLVPKLGFLGAIYANIIAISICIFVAYFVLHLEGINIFFKNLKAILVSLLATFVSAVLVVIYRVCFLLNHYPAYYGVILYSIMMVGIYYLSLKIFKQSYKLCIK